MGSAGHSEVNEILSHLDNEAEQNNNIYTHEVHPKDKQPCSNTEAPGEESSRVSEFQQTNEFNPKDDDNQKTDQPHPDEEAGLDSKSHYDRGWAWVVCGTTFLMEFFVGGLITSSGVIYATLVDEFNKSRAETGKSQ